MIRSFYNGVSGAKSSSFGTDILANNIANVNSTGFKAGVAEFKDIFYERNLPSRKNPLSNQVGLGATKYSSAPSFRQGNMQPGEKDFDLAIFGRGFFCVKGQGKEELYTRNGDFLLNKDCFLVDNQGRYLQGIMNGAFTSEKVEGREAELAKSDTAAIFGDFVDPLEGKTESDIVKISNLSSLQLPKNTISKAEPTSEISLKTALNASYEIGLTNIDIDAKETADIKNAELKENELLWQLEQGANGPKLTIAAQIAKSTELHEPKPGDKVIIAIKKKGFKERHIEVILDDKLQAKRVLEGEMAQNIERISAHVVTKQERSQTQTHGTFITGENGERQEVKIVFKRHLPVGHDPSKMKFNAKAYLLDALGEEIAQSSGVLEFANGAMTVNTLHELGGLKLDLGSTKEEGVPNTGYEGVTASLGSDARSSFIKANGHNAGFLKGYTTEEDGRIIAHYSNGKTAIAARIVVQNFINERGLEQRSGTLFSQSKNSGEPYYQAKSHLIKAGFLEGSNVDLAEELTKLIIMQKSFDANAKSITTADALLRRAIDMKK